MALGELKNGIGPDAYAIYQQVLAAVVERDHPVGSLYISEKPTSPAELYGGTWERIENRTIWGASDTHPAGTTIEAGLPNITGSVAYGNDPNTTWARFVSTYGAFYAARKEVGIVFKEDKSIDDVIILAGFDASLSNPIYGASDTVQPPAYCTYIWRRVA